MMADDEDSDAQDADDDEPSCNSLSHCSSMDDRLHAEC